MRFRRCDLILELIDVALGRRATAERAPWAASGPPGATRAESLRLVPKGLVEQPRPMVEPLVHAEAFGA